MKGGYEMEIILIPLAIAIVLLKVLAEAFTSGGGKC